MKRRTVTITDELEQEFEAYKKMQDAVPSFTAVVQAALSDYFNARKLYVQGFKPATKPFNPKPLQEKDDLGEPDVSINHDQYFGEA